jgi:hypothetical protein
MQVHGILKVKFDTQVVSEKFSKREFVLTTDSTTPYPQQVSFQVTQDKCGILDRYNEGDEISVDFNLRGREWNGPQGVKYFNTLEAWKIELVNKGNNQPVNNSGVNNDLVNNSVNNSSTDNKDLPF